MGSKSKQNLHSKKFNLAYNRQQIQQQSVLTSHQRYSPSSLLNYQKLLLKLCLKYGHGGNILKHRMKIIDDIFRRLSYNPALPDISKTILASLIFIFVLLTILQVAAVKKVIMPDVENVQREIIEFLTPDEIYLVEEITAEKINDLEQDLAKPSPAPVCSSEKVYNPVVRGFKKNTINKTSLNPQYYCVPKYFKIKRMQIYQTFLKSYQLILEPVRPYLKSHNYDAIEKFIAKHPETSNHPELVNASLALIKAVMYFEKGLDANKCGEYVVCRSAADNFFSISLRSLEVALQNTRKFYSKNPHKEHKFDESHGDLGLIKLFARLSHGCMRNFFLARKEELASIQNFKKLQQECVRMKEYYKNHPSPCSKAKEKIRLWEKDMQVADDCIVHYGRFIYGLSSLEGLIKRKLISVDYPELPTLLERIKSDILRNNQTKYAASSTILLLFFFYTAIKFAGYCCYNKPKERKRRKKMKLEWPAYFVPPKPRGENASNPDLSCFESSVTDNSSNHYVYDDPYSSAGTKRSGTRKKKSKRGKKARFSSTATNNNNNSNATHITWEEGEKKYSVPVDDFIPVYLSGSSKIAFYAYINLKFDKDPAKKAYKTLLNCAHVNNNIVVSDTNVSGFKPLKKVEYKSVFYEKLWEVKKTRTKPRFIADNETMIKAKLGGEGVNVLYFPVLDMEGLHK